MDFLAARRNMVDSQIRTTRVTDKRVIDAMLDIPRERFVPKERRSLAYSDEAVGLGDGRFLMEPMVLARLLQFAELESTDDVLVIGCATGYSAAVVARLAKTVVGLESDHKLAAQAAENLVAVGADNAVVLEGDLRAGCPKQAPFHLILFDGAICEVPPALAAQTRDGSRVVAVVQKPGRMAGRGTVFTSIGGRLTGRDVFDAGSPLLPGFAPEPAFTF